MLSKFFIFLFMPISLLAMDQAQQGIYDALTPAIDAAYAQFDGQKAVSLGPYNQALLDVLQSVADAGATSLQWANNRMAVIRIDLEKANVQFNAIESIVGKFKNLVGQAKTRQQAAARLGQIPNANDQALLNSEGQFEGCLQRSIAIIEAIRVHAARAEQMLVDANNTNNEVDNVIGQVNVPILNNDYGLQDINQSRAAGAVAYHLKLHNICRYFQTFNEHIFHIKDIADTIRQNANLPALDLVLQALDAQATVLGLPR